MFALLISLAAGLKVIISSSSDKKLQRLKQLGNVRTINYKTHPDVEAEVLRLKDGKGVDYVINNAGISSIPTDLEMLRKGGNIAPVGFLAGFSADLSPSILMSLIEKNAKIQ